MRHFKVTLEYDGTAYAGFQYQVGQPSIQAELERAIQKLTGSTDRVNGAGRTDAGVHALGQVISFSAETRVPTEKLAIALNGELPRDIAAVRAEEVDDRFHARFSAKRRAYVYLILNRPNRSALLGRFSWHMPRDLDMQSMQAAARLIPGTRDFRAWANSTDETNSTIREVVRCDVRKRKAFVLVYVEANAFLRGMVRNIVGTLVDVGVGKRPPEEMDEITRTGRRELAGPTAPASGLTLVRVRYT
jgi:tRNA pseudouridine38-40 synthase